MKKRKNSTVLLASIICSSILLLAFSCDADIPIREMAGAKNAIVDAKKYDADKHAPDDMKKAEALLIQSHTQLIDGQDEDAEKSANDAALAANNAKNKSLKPYADSKIKQSDEMQDAADKAFAERFSPNNFAQGKKLNSEAKAQHGQGDYVKSAETAVSSSNFFAAAIEDSTKNSSSINNEIATVERRLTELRRDKNSGAASANLTRAESSVRNAKNSYAKQDFKASWREIDSAKKELDAAALAINRQRVSASIAEVRADIKNAREGDLPPDAVNDLNAATAELDAADGLLRQNNFRDAEVRVNRAVSLVNSAKAKIKKYEEEHYEKNYFFNGKRMLGIFNLYRCCFGRK